MQTPFTELPQEGGHFHIGSFGDMPAFRVSIFSKSSRTGCKISVKIPEQASQQATLLQNMSNLSWRLPCQWITMTSCISLTLIFPEQLCHLPNIFQNRVKKNFPGKHLPIFVHTVTPPPQLNSDEVETDMLTPWDIKMSSYCHYVGFLHW